MSKTQALIDSYFKAKDSKNTPLSHPWFNQNAYKKIQNIPSSSSHPVLARSYLRYIATNKKVPSFQEFHNLQSFIS